MAAPKISVLVATYNHAPYVVEALDSVFTQSFKDLEVIVANDGSTDNTAKILDAIKEPRLTCLHLPKNRGVNSALNAALAKAQGEYVAVLDSDDTFAPEKLAAQAAFLDEHPEIGAVYTLARMIDAKGNDIPDHPLAKKFRTDNKHRHRWLEFMFNVGGFLCSHSFMLRRSCFEKTGPFDPRLAKIPDIEYQVRLLMHYDIHILPLPLLNYRRLDVGGESGGRTNASTRTNEGYLQSRLEMIELTRNFYRITDFDELMGVFPFLLQQSPGLESIRNQFTPGMANFLLAMLGLSINAAHQRLLAMETLYRLMADDRDRADLEHYFGFSYPNLFELARKQDVFQYFKILSPDWAPLEARKET